jgi:hypothetical protein
VNSGAYLVAIGSPCRSWVEIIATKFFGRHDMLVDFTGIFILLRIFYLPFITYSVEYFVLLVCVLWFVSICACATELSILGRPYIFTRIIRFRVTFDKVKLISTNNKILIPLFSVL